MGYIILTEYAFAKLLWFRKNCHENNVLDTKYVKSDFLEVSLMGISKSEEHDGLLTVEDFVCVPQECSTGLTEPTDEGMALYFEEMMLDKNIMPNRCGRIWAHTHPGVSPTPSGTDRETFSKWFKDAEFAVMYILADGADHCEVKHTSKQFGSMTTSVTTYVLLNKKDVDGSAMFISTNFVFEVDKLSVKMHEAFGSFVQSTVFEDYSKFHHDWLAELKRCVKKKSYNTTSPANTATTNTTSVKTGDLGGLNKRERKRQQRIGFTNNFGIDTLIRILIRNKKNTINELGHKGIAEIAAHYDIHTSKVQQTYSNLIQFEKFCTVDLILDRIDALIVNNRNAIKENLIGDSLLTDICIEMSARPAHISEIIDDLLTRAAHDVG